MININVHPAKEGDFFSPLTGSIFGINELRLNRIEFSAETHTALLETNLVEWLIELTNLLRRAVDNGYAEIKKTLPFSGDKFNGRVSRDGEGTLIIFDSTSRRSETFNLSWQGFLEIHKHVYEYIDHIAASNGGSLEKLKESQLVRLPAM